MAAGLCPLVQFPILVPCRIFRAALAVLPGLTPRCNIECTSVKEYDKIILQVHRYRKTEIEVSIEEVVWAIERAKAGSLKRSKD